MGTRNAYPISFTPRGLSDAQDSTRAFPGACTSLQNLTFDQINPEWMVPRPGVVAPAGWLTAVGNIEGFIVLGDYAYGWASGKPFCINLATNSSVTVTQSAGMNGLPAAMSGTDPVRPEFAMVGSLLVCTHPNLTSVNCAFNATASVVGNTLTVTAITSGFLRPSGRVKIGVNNTYITGFVPSALGATVGGVGIYTIADSLAAAGPLAIDQGGAGTSQVASLGVFDLTVPSAPIFYIATKVISGSNLTGYANESTIQPKTIANYNGRLYASGSDVAVVSGVGSKAKNVVFYSDNLNPLWASSASQSLTLGDNNPVVKLSGLPIQTSSSGVAAGLIAFKAFQIWQILGDAAITNSLTLNHLSLNVGTVAPRSVVQTPQGLMFSSVDGPYFVDQLGRVQALTKDSSRTVQDVQSPFQRMINPNATCAGYSGSIYRVCINYSAPDGTATFGDFWFDTTQRRWVGPHTFKYTNIDQYSNYFIVANGTGQLYKSEYFTSPTSVFTDDGTSYTCVLTTSFLPKMQNPNVKQIIESTLELGVITYGKYYTVTATDERYGSLDTCTITFSAAPVWGDGRVWGDPYEWAGPVQGMLTTTIPWHQPLTFKKLALTISANADPNLAIACFSAKVQDTGRFNF